MARYTLQRFLSLLGIAIAATVIVFLVLTLVPGDPALLILGPDATAEGIAVIHKKLGLDQPLWTQYLNFVSGLFHGDLGISYQRGVPVAERIVEAYPITVILSTTAMILAVIFGVGLGVVSAIKANTWIDNTLRVILLTFTSVPVYWLGLLLIFGFAVRWLHLPSFGWGTPMHLVLPAITLATFPLAVIGRITRTATLDVINEDYVLTARAKGLTATIVAVRHIFRNALIPVVTVISLQFGVLLAGAVLTETVFSIPGMGNLLITAIFSRDYAMIRGTVLVGVLTVVCLNFAVDLLYLVIDPRIKYQ